MTGLRLWLVIVAFLAGALLAACGGDGDGDADGAAERYALADIPVPAGADEVSSGRFSGDLPFGVPGQDIDPEAFTTPEIAEFEVDASPEEIIDFYRDALAGWDEVVVFSGEAEGEEGGGGIWSRDDGRVVVFIVTDSADGATSLTIIRGSAD